MSSTRSITEMGREDIMIRIDPMPTTSPVNIIGVTIEPFKFVQKVIRDLRNIYRELYIRCMIDLSLYSALVTGIPHTINSIREFYIELSRITSVIDSPSCLIDVNNKYIIWRNICACMVDYMKKHVIPTDLIVRTMESVTELVLRQESETGGVFNIQKSLTYGECVYKNNMVSELIEIPSVKKVISVVQIAAKLERTRDRSPTRRVTFAKEVQVKEIPKINRGRERARREARRSKRNSQAKPDATQ